MVGRICQHTQLEQKVTQEFGRTALFKLPPLIQKASRGRLLYLKHSADFYMGTEMVKYLLNKCQPSKRVDCIML